MEVFLEINRGLAILTCLLHVRGGVSIRRRRFYEDGEVFSTSVEVFPLSDAPVENRLSLLHVRGGVSTPMGTRFEFF